MVSIFTAKMLADYAVVYRLIESLRHWAVEWNDFSFVFNDPITP